MPHHFRPTKNGKKIEVRFTHRRLAKPVFTTKDTQEDAEFFVKFWNHHLDTGGDIPAEFTKIVATPAEKKIPLTVMLKDYLADSTAGIQESDKPLVNFLINSFLKAEEGKEPVCVSDLTVLWVRAWITEMKQAQKLTPGTIRKRVGCLGRAYHWWLRLKFGENALPANPLKTLPRGYSTYTEEDVRIAGVRKVDVHRDRRLESGEYEAIEAVIMGNKRPDKERDVEIPHPEDFLLMWRLIVNTGLRLREAYRLRWKDVRFEQKTIHVYKSKMKTTREIPMTREVYAWLKDASVRKTDKLVFPFWDGVDEKEEVLKAVTSKLSTKFATIFNHTGCENLTEHDLRHEATCRWVMMKNQNGDWMFRAEEVRKITGHKTDSQFMRYMSLRGSDLAQRLW